MRRDIKNEEKLSTGMIIGGIVAVALVLTSLIVYFINNNSSSNNNYQQGQVMGNANNTVNNDVNNTVNKSDELEDASVQMGKTVEEANQTNSTNTAKSENSVAQNNVSTNSNTSDTKKQDTNSTKTEEKNEVVEEIPQKQVKFVAPIKGVIQKEFAPDSLVYSETLEEWIIHNGVDIKADKTSVVTAAADGKVSAIKDDPRYGLTVIINHENGYQTVYSNLLTTEFVVEGEEVKQGQTIATVGNSASFEIADETHLHFELLQNNEYLNPTIYMEF